MPNGIGKQANRKAVAMRFGEANSFTLAVVKLIATAHVISQEKVYAQAK